MAYKSKFLHFKTKASYNAERAKTTAGTEERKVFDAYISFIDEGPTICTWGKEYQCDANSLSVLPQELTTEDQNQVFKNLGWNVHIISQSDINAGSSPSNEEKAKRLEATALLVKETSNIYLRGNDDSSNHYFFKVNSSSQIELLRISITTGIIYRTNTQFIDEGLIRYDRAQSLTEDQKALVRENIDAASKEEVLPLTIDMSSTSVEDYNTALEAFNSKKPLTILDSSDPTARFTSITMNKETDTNDINIYFSFTGINYDNALNTVGYVAKIKSTGEKTESFAALVPSNLDPKPLASVASPGTDNAYSRSDHVHPAQKSVAKLETPRVIAIVGAISGSTPFDGSSNVIINSTLNGFDASKITSGTLNANRLPAATSSTYGGIQIGYTTNGKNYAVQLSNGKAYVNVPWTDTNINCYPTTFTWANGTTAGPTGSLTGSGMSTVSFGAIPSASATQSGVVTTGDQTFGGIKTIDTINVTNINEATPGKGFWIGYNTEGVIRIGKDGDYDFGTSGGTYSGTANTAKRLLNSLQFSNGQSFNGSSAVTIDLPEIPIALPNPYALTINGTSYTGSSAVFINTSKPLIVRLLTSSTVDAGYSYSCDTSKAISTLHGFSAANPDSVITSSAKLTFTASNVIKMDGLDDLSGTWYIYCLSYMANSKIAVNGAVYA